MPTIRDVLGDPQPVTYVPYRNMILIALGLSFAESNGCDAVFSGLQAQDQYAYWDTSNAFVTAMNGVSALNRQHTVTLEAPFAGMTKAQELYIAKDLRVPLEDTYTCYAGDAEGACGVCPSCAERIKNFMDAGIKDPVPYKIRIPWPVSCAG